MVNMARRTLTVTIAVRASDQICAACRPILYMHVSGEALRLCFEQRHGEKASVQGGAEYSHVAHILVSHQDAQLPVLVCAVHSGMPSRRAARISGVSTVEDR